MKKAGILTFHNAINYGAVLQAYALRKTIHTKGIHCDIINYYCPAIEGTYKYIYTNSIKKILSSIINAYFLYKRKKKFNKFKDYELTLTKKVDKKNIESLNDDYQYFIV